MAEGQVGIEFSAEERDVLNTFDEMNARAKRLLDSMKKVGKAGEDGGRRTKNSMDSAAASVAQFVGKFAGVTSVIGGALAVVNTLKTAYRELLALEKEKADAQADAGAAIRKTQLAFTPDKTLNRRQLAGALEKVSLDTGAKLTTAVAPAAETAFSAAGSIDNKTVVETLKQSARIAPFDAELLKELSQRSLDVQKISKVSPKASLGFLLQSARGSRVTNVAQFGKTGTKALAALVSSGDTLEQAAELFAATTQLGTDDEGARSATGLIQLAAQFKEFVPKGQGKDERGRFRVPKDQIAAFNRAKSTTERIAVLQRSPELRRQFLGKASFEAAVKDPFNQLLSGTARGKAELAAAQGKIDAPNEAQGKIFDSFLSELGADKFAAGAEARDRAEANAQQFLRSKSIGARKAQVRDIVFEKALKKVNLVTGPDAPERGLLSLQLEKRFAFNAESPEQSGLAILRRARDYGALESDERKLIDRQIALLERIHEQMKLGYQASREQTDVIKNQQAAPAPQKVPAAALGGNNGNK